MEDKEYHHVHFPESVDLFGKNNEISVQGSPGGESVSIHLGFLQVGHRYEIVVELPYSLCQAKESGHLIVRDSVPGKVPSVNCKVNDISKTHTGFLMKMELLAFKEKLLKEELFLECSTGQVSIAALTVTLIARVLGKMSAASSVKWAPIARVEYQEICCFFIPGKGKGTPMLKNGIHCIGVELDDESEASDWQGFS